MGQIINYAYSLPIGLIDSFYHSSGLSWLVEKACHWNAKPTLDDVRASLEVEAKLWKFNKERYLNYWLWRKYLDRASDESWQVGDREEFWDRAARKQIGSGSITPQPLFKRALEMIEESQSSGSRLAIEIGGGGNTCHPQLLLDRGWSVILVERSQVAAELLTSIFQEAIESGRLEIVCQDVADYEFPTNVELIYAYDLLPYCDPEKIVSIWTNISESLIEDGLFVGNFHLSPWYDDTYQRLLGAWYIKKSHVDLLLESKNYKKELLQVGNQSPFDPISFEFIARK